jgi:hypothetical protein
MQMRKLSLNLLLLSAGWLLCSFPSPISSQDAESLKPRKVDAYNDKIRSGEAEQWHLEDFRAELLKEPGAKAYIIAYGGLEDEPGKARRYTVRAKNYLVNARGIEPARINTIDGGRREEFIVELWLVPDGARPPQPEPTVTVQDDLRDNLLFDSFAVDCENFGCGYEDEAAQLDGFAAALKKEPNSWGCIIAYAQSGDDRVGMSWDSPGTALKVARGQKNYLLKQHGLAPTKITAVDGGYSGRVVELWVMRPGARFDKGPFVYSDRLKAVRTNTLTIAERASTEICCRACVHGSPQPDKGMRRTRRSARFSSTKGRARR